MIFFCEVWRKMRNFARNITKTGMMKANSILLSAAFAALALSANGESFKFDMTKSQPAYSDATGYGYEVGGVPEKNSTKPFYFSVKVPDGNYRVTVKLGSAKRAANTTVRAEDRRLFVEPVNTKKKEFKTYTFTVSKRSPQITPEINGSKIVKIKPGEKAPDCRDWDDRLTLEFNGTAPAVQSIEIVSDTTATTLFLCGNSTVTDQRHEPYASWGQMVTRWFTPEVSVCNVAESGLTASSFLAQNRLDKILSMMKPGDYVIVEFGHNDEKEKNPGAGPWFNYTFALKKYIDQVRAKGGNIIFCTPTARRRFENGKNKNTHGDYPAAMKLVAEKCNVPLIDLNEKVTTLYETLGESDSKKTLVHYAMGTFPGQKKELADNTHFSTYGAYEVAKIVVQGLKDNNISGLTKSLKDFTSFSPSSPDDYNSFVWPWSLMVDTEKPDGN